MYIPDLPTYLVFYLETTHGSSIDPLMSTTPTHFKSLYVPEEDVVLCRGHTFFLCVEGLANKSENCTYDSVYDSTYDEKILPKTPSTLCLLGRTFKFLCTNV